MRWWIWKKIRLRNISRESEPNKAHKGYAWSTAIGLQAVDGLKAI